MNTKKVLSALLTSAMVLGSASFTAMADTTTGNELTYGQFLKTLADNGYNYNFNNATIKLVTEFCCTDPNHTDCGYEDYRSKSMEAPQRIQGTNAQYQFGKDYDGAVTIKNANFTVDKSNGVGLHLKNNYGWEGEIAAGTDFNVEFQFLNNGDLTIENCTFDGINVAPFHKAGSTAEDVVDTFTGNTFKNVYNAYGIQGAYAKNVVATGNTFEKCSGGIYLEGAGKTKIELTGNSFSNMGSYCPAAKKDTRGLVQISKAVTLAAGATAAVSNNTSDGSTPFFRWLSDSAADVTVERNTYGGNMNTADANVTFDENGTATAWPTGKTVKVGEDYYATLKEALTAAYTTNTSNADIVIDCKPGANVGAMTHGHVAHNMTINGNGATVDTNNSGEQDLELDTYKFAGTAQSTGAGSDLTGEITVTVNDLNGIAAWGQRESDNTVNLIFKNCKNMCRVYFSGTKGTTNVTLENCSFNGNIGHGSTKNTSIYSNAKGNITLNNVTFENVAIPVNIKNKSNGTQTIKIENCTFTDCSTNALAAATNSAAYAAPVRIVTEGDAVATNVTVKDCTFTNSGEAMDAQILLGDGRIGENPTDKVKVTVEGATADVTVKTDYPEADTRNDSTVTVPAGETASVAMGLADKVAVAFEKAAGAADNEAKYDLYIDGDAKTINRLTSAQLTFAIHNDNIDYEIVGAQNVTVTPDNAVEGKYLFNFDGANAADASGARIKLATVTFTGIGTFTFTVDAAAANQVHATTAQDNIVTTFVVAPAAATEGTLVLGEGVTDEIKKATRSLTVNITFPNAIADQKAAYQDMKVVISGGDLPENLVYKLGTGNNAIALENGAYVLNISDKLTKDLAFTVTVSGAGYRTARYTVTMTADKVLNFWNNVKDTPAVVEEGSSTGAKSVTFLAGDIVKDGKINIYDLSAVVSYFGTINNVNDKSEYAKYDLNRDGKIDSKDVAYVLVSWGK